ncbi:hypothetical protein WDZ16_02555 [Pseudokineococcus marinus]|uniref:Asp23/Gls24 family envelope stress response protein n=1 Tax=Pseudokineococcus marinus TaxID=351215 RepID=A0A849BMA8_9ACTN|nr:Asp23/Gls24 family envelope stress response protein [Pseudokineococcus marinus]NNH21764.1 Asp23/Gls24 family envelope stress response protein [Pseudokineococcus marinus]
MSSAPGAPDPERDVAEVVRDAVVAAPGVVSLHAGPFGEVGTYLPGRRVAGVRISEDEVEVHVVAALGQPVAVTSAAVMTALADLPAWTGLADRPAHVVVEDVADPAEAAQAALPAGPSS